MTRSALSLLMVSALAGAASAGDPIPGGIGPAPRAFRDAVAHVLPSIVTIETYGTSTLPVGRAHRRAIKGFSRPGEGPTTGLICSSDGFVLTSTYNFVRKPKIITVMLHDGSRKVARLVGKDETRQLALLKIAEADDLPTVTWAPRRALRVGQWAIAVGVGYGGAEPAISVGILSALERISGKAVQTDANLSPANYGGPLIDLDGRVIGLCTPLAPGAANVMAGAQWYDSGIGFAVPLDDLGPILDRLKAGQTIHRGLLGVVLNTQPVSGGGVAIRSIAKNSPAEQVQLKVGDVIRTINGRSIFDMLDLRKEVGRYPAGESVVLGLTRDGKAIDVKLTLQAGPFSSPSKKPPKPADSDEAPPAAPKP